MRRLAISLSFAAASAAARRCSGELPGPTEAAEPDLRRPGLPGTAAKADGDAGDARWSRSFSSLRAAILPRARSSRRCDSANFASRSARPFFLGDAAIWAQHKKGRPYRRVTRDEPCQGFGPIWVMVATGDLA